MRRLQYIPDSKSIETILEDMRRMKERLEAGRALIARWKAEDAHAERVLDSLNAPDSWYQVLGSRHTRSAVHEAAHAVVAETLSPRSVKSIHLGWRSLSPERPLPLVAGYCDAELPDDDRRVIVLMAGPAVETFFCGAEDWNHSAGAAGDRDMIIKYLGPRMSESGRMWNETLALVQSQPTLDAIMAVSVELLDKRITRARRLREIIESQR